MLRSLLLFTVFTVSINTVNAQELYMPREIKAAYKNETRSPDGRPGKNYWQNHGRYDITVKAMPPDRTVHGSEQISYTNNSPDTLKNLLFKLIVNIHKPGAVRLRPESSDYLTSGIHIDSFAVNGKALPWQEIWGYNTVHPVKLDEPLVPHDSVKLFVKWHYDASLKSNREGMIDSTTYFLAYSYPRVAVYDDYHGWDALEFNDRLEFYNDFNDYTLHVQVPENYIVWATGDLQNPDEVLQAACADKLKRSMSSDDIFHIATKDELLAKKVTAKNAVNTWTFKAGNVSDVAFGLSDHFNWDASSVVVDTLTGRRASVQAAYNDTAADYHAMVKLARHSLRSLSTAWPGIPYPYSKTSIFQGYADMEYPMMVNDESYPDTTFAGFVAAHEIAHTYMPFYMGINETVYGFMDEGWATTFELLFNRQNMGREKADDLYKKFRVTGWIHDPSADEDLPIMTPGPDLNGRGLGSNEYVKPSLGYLAVKELLGDALFKKCLHEYMSRWNGRHPIPWDFFYTFNDASGKNLNWFWNNWFFSKNYIDLAVDKVVKGRGGYSVFISNIGGMAAPFDLVVSYVDGTKDILHQTPKVWEADQRRTAVKIAAKKDIRSVKIDGGIFMDADETNNGSAL